MNLLQEYAQLKKEIDTAQSRIEKISNQLETEVKTGGHPIAQAGYIAKMKPGRKSTDHRAAAMSAGVSDELIAKYTIVKDPVTSWAKVTKAAEISKWLLDEYTTQGKDVFSISEI